MHYLTGTLTAALLLSLSFTTSAIAGKGTFDSSSKKGSINNLDGTNNLGHFVGFGRLDNGHYYDGALYDGNAWHKLAGPNEDGIPSPPNIISSQLYAFDANDINDAGQVVGGGYGGAGVMINPVIADIRKGGRTWYLDKNNDGKNDLITKILVDGYNDQGRATHITENGMILGTLYDARRTLAEGGDQNRFYRWTPQSGALIFDAPYPTYASIVDVNESGQVIGTCRDRETRRYSSPGFQVAFYWSEETGTITVPNSLGSHTWLYDINEVGEVVGAAYFPDTETRYTFRWKPTTGEITTLPDFGSAYAINDKGQISGNVSGESSEDTYTAIWDAQNNIRVLGNGQYTRCTVTDFNNNGYGVGYCYQEETQKVFVAWVPDAITGSYSVKAIKPNKNAAPEDVGIVNHINEQNQVLTNYRKKNGSTYDLITIQ